MTLTRNIYLIPHIAAGRQDPNGALCVTESEAFVSAHRAGKRRFGVFEIGKKSLKGGKFSQCSDLRSCCWSARDCQVTFRDYIAFRNPRRIAFRFTMKQFTVFNYFAVLIASLLYIVRANPLPANTLTKRTEICEEERWTRPTGCPDGWVSSIPALENIITKRMDTYELTMRFIVSASRRR